MSIYPAIGGAASYPARYQLTVTCRAVSATMPGGREIATFDPGQRTVEWRMSYQGLSDAEAAVLRNFFAAQGGRLRTFTFLDPLSNLLAWTEALDNAAWSRDGGLTPMHAGAGPGGGGTAWTLQNGAGADQSIVQSIPVAANSPYCVSVWAMGGSGVVRLRAGASVKNCTPTPGWTRVQMAGVNGPGDGTLTFGVTVPGGQSVVVFGPQVEVQGTASRYKTATARSGVCAQARFSSDAMECVADGYGTYSMNVSVTGELGG